MGTWTLTDIEQPDLVSALIIEDVGTQVDRDLSYCLAWPDRAPTRAELVRQLGQAPVFLAASMREYPDGWGLAFRPQDMVTSAVPDGFLAAVRDLLDGV